MKVLIVSEGQHELGDAETPGALVVFVRRLLGSDIIVETDRVSNPAVHTHRGKGRGYFKRCLRWIREAEKRNFDALILVIDEDEFKERIDEVNEAQRDAIFSLPRALGVAIHTFDAWMLADEKALTAVLGYQVNRQAKAEEISDPKQLCRDLLANSSSAASLSDLYAKLAPVIDIAQLRIRCPNGFAVVAERIEQLSAT